MMDILLRFRSKSYSQAYMQDIAFELKKKFIISLIYFVLFVVANTSMYAFQHGAQKNAITLGIRCAVVIMFVFGLYCIRRKASELKLLKLYNLIFEIIAIGSSVSLIPESSNINIDKLRPFERMLWGWTDCLNLIAIISFSSNWWLKVLAILVQIVFFLGFEIKSGSNRAIILIQCFNVVIFFLAVVYYSEKYQRMDFTEKRKTQDNLEAIKKIFDDIGEGILIFDRDYKILYSNKQILATFSLTKDTMTIEKVFSMIKFKSKNMIIPGEPSVKLIQDRADKPMIEMLHEISNQLFKMQKAGENEAFASLEGHCVTNFREELGGINYEEDRNYLIKFRSSKYMEKDVIVANILDTTQRDALIAAQDSNNYKTRLLASVSHELRTPLNGSINFTEQALSDASVPENIKKRWLLPALRSNRLLLSLINDILDFSQIQENKLRLVFETKDVVEIANDCIELLEIQATRRGIQLILECELSERDRLINTDHNRVRQVLLNFLSNAVKFTFEGSVTLKIKEAPPLNSSNFFEGLRKTPIIQCKGIQISCTDTGIGISAENQKKLFKAFEKIELGDKIAVNSSGVGLGLVISNNLVQRLVPDKLAKQVKELPSIKFTSSEGQGSCFYFDLYDQRDVKTLELNLKKYEAHSRINSSTSFLFQGQLQGLGSPDLSVFTEDPLDQKALYQIEREIVVNTSDPMSPAKTSISKLSFNLPGNRENKLGLDRFSFRATKPVYHPSKNCCPPLLIVDDDAFNLTALEQNLSNLKISCECAFNGRQAIEKILKRQKNQCANKCPQFSVIFLDCNMPVLDGFETAAILRGKINDGEIDHMRIIACTAFVEQSELDKTKAAGMDDYCTKPVSVAVLKEKLSQFGFYTQ